MAKLTSKQILLATLSVLAIGASIAFLVFQLRQPKTDFAVHQAVGEIIAEQIPSLTNNARVVVITIDSHHEPELAWRRAGFELAVAKLPGVKVLDWEEVDTKGKSKYGPGRGLSLERYLRLVKKNPEGNLFVSLIGAPDFEKDELKDLPSPLPRLLAEARVRDGLLELFDKGVLHAAIVPRFVFPAPEKPRKTPRDKFELYWQILNPANVPREEEEKE
jgi:hypothetical protein